MQCTSSQGPAGRGSQTRCHSPHSSKTESNVPLGCSASSFKQPSRSGCKPTPEYLRGVPKAILFPSLVVATYAQFGATSMPEDLARVVRQPRQT